MKPDDRSISQDFTVRTKSLAVVLGVSERRVQQLADTGVIRAVARNTWALAECVQRVIDHYKGTPAKSDAAERLTTAKAEAMELANIAKSRALIKEAEARTLEMVDDLIGPIKGDLFAIPARVTADLQIRLRIEREIDAVLQAAAKRSNKLDEQEA